MSKLGDMLKLFAAELALPSLVNLGDQALHDVLVKLSIEKPKKFAILLQSMYPTFKGVLEPLVHSTKTDLDDKVADPTTKMLEDLMTERGIPIPVVIPIDFTTDDSDLPAVNTAA